MNVIITGATKGIGYAIAEQFAAAGYNLIVCARSKEDLEKMEKEFSARFPSVSIYVKVADVGDSNQVKDFGRWILESGFTPDIVINNAGYFVPGSVYNEKEGTLQKMMEVNLNSAYHLTRSLLPAMTERKKGHIFTICSIASFQPLANVGSYGISKFALLGFTKHLREEMKPYGIKVTAVIPGATYTPSWEGSGINLERILQADDVAKMVFACSQLSLQAVVEEIVIRPELGDL